MPELPEVETVVRGLGEYIPGQKIKEILPLHKKSLILYEKINPNELTDLKILKISRRGKGIIIDLEKDWSLLIHLKMTGQLIYIDKTARLNLGHPNNDFLSSMPSKHTRVVIQLSKGTLYFNDQRIFGWVKILPTAEVMQDPFIQKLGPEPFDPSFSANYFWSVLQRRPKAPIKAVLLDQSVVSGIGNIYADESLWMSKIHPTRPAITLTRREADLLHKHIIEVLKEGIKYRGTSLTHHRTAAGSAGGMQKYLQVFRQEGKPCPRCGTTIQKMRAAGRGTHFCPTCQK